MRNTIIISYYEAPLMLATQIQFWAKYPEDVKVIVVDDGSEEHPALPIIKSHIKGIKAKVELYRIKENIFQNVYGARNLGFHVAEDGWIWNVDIDHVVPVESIKLFNDAGLTPDGKYYLPSRKSVVDKNTFVLIHKHSDTFITTKSTFWKTGGYDELLVGYYFNGASKKFRDALNKVAKGVNLRQDGGVFTLFFSQQMVNDASPIAERRTYPRRLSHGTKPTILKFNWEKQL